MSKINILDESVFNKIAAGEVVEKPASVVKELLDNAIDAGSTKITVDITDGGIKNITVIDNGCGIETDDFDKVFVAHATSKIKSADDLAKIGTLGFRGEALASIASVSKVELTSKTYDQTLASFCTIQGGKQSLISTVGADTGTKISVSDLFYNVPARAKFLRKPKTEANDITNLIEKYILCNPNISFLYISNNKTVLQSTGTNLFDAIYVVYGKQATENIIKVESFNKTSHIKVSGYIGLPTFSKPNRTYQTLSINGRYVNSPVVSACIGNAYEHFLMKGQFPFFVLDLQIPLDKLDVNVHPNKMEVRFGNSNEIYGNVFSAVNTALVNCEKITSVDDSFFAYKDVVGGESFDATMQTEKFQENTDNFNETKQVDEKPKVVEITTMQSTQNFAKASSFITDLFKPSSDTMHDNSNSILNKLALKQYQQNGTPQQTMLTQTQDAKSKTDDFFETSDVKFVGEIFATYLIIEKQQKVYIIDQHAGHERLLYDRLVKEVDSKNVTKQTLLVPFHIDVNRQEFEFLQENLNKLECIGFEIEQFGQLSFMVTSIPAILRDINLKEFFDSIFKDLTIFKNYKQSDLITDKLMQHSCKCAVRAGKILSAGEVNSLITQMKEEKMQLQCPHGRPVVVELKKTDIEKWFKRIVWCKSKRLF